MITSRKVDREGLSLIKHFEALSLKTHQGSDGGATIGWDMPRFHTMKAVPPPGQYINELEAENF